MSGLLLAVDGGQTGTRALLAQADGTVVEERRAGPIRHLFGEGGAETRSALEEAIGKPGVPVAAAALAITGVMPGSPEAEKVSRMVEEIVAPERITVVPDYVANLLGASAGGPGIVVVAGGGAVAYGRSAGGQEAVAGGDGYLLGDEGGGYDIGRRAVSAALRAGDGRGVPTALTDVVCRAFDLTDITQIKRVVYAPGFDRGRLAALAPEVAAVSEEDAVAASILEDAGRALAVMTLAVADRLFPPGSGADVYPTGGVFRAGEPLLLPFRQALSARPDLTVRSPAYPPLVGSLLLAMRLAGVAHTGWLRQLRVTESYTGSFM